jgi:hypothetical protein
MSFPRVAPLPLLLVALATLALAAAAQGTERRAPGRYPLGGPPPSALGTPVLEHPAMTNTVRLPPALESLPPTRPSVISPPIVELPPVPATGLEALEKSVLEHPHEGHAELGRGAYRLPYFGEDFGEPIYYELPYDPLGEIGAYAGKSPVPTQRPWIEWGRPFYEAGPIPRSSTILGDSNLVAPQFLLYGDIRTAVASNNNGGSSSNLVAARTNLEADLRLTATERFHAGFQPMNKGQNFTRVDFNSNGLRMEEEFNVDPFTLFFEGDVGAMWGGATGQVMPFDLPVAVGLMPLVFQNGVWMEDNVLGAAVTIPARNSPVFDISNYDITFFCLFDQLSSPAFQSDDNAARAYGVASFFEMLDGYIELDYAYLDDRSVFSRSYHNIGLGYTRRYFSFLSNSVRVIGNAGQDPNGIEPTAEGVLLLSENSLITSNPYLFVPYFNTFIGFGQVQSAARNGAAGGILRNTGILFETDNLTGYPTLDPTAIETYGGAVGLNMIPATIDRQFVIEYAFVGVRGDPGVRFQRNLTNAWLFRADAMYGFRDHDNDLSGARMELRYKF